MVVLRAPHAGSVFVGRVSALHHQREWSNGPAKDKETGLGNCCENPQRHSRQIGFDANLKRLVSMNRSRVEVRPEHSRRSMISGNAFIHVGVL